MSDLKKLFDYCPSCGSEDMHFDGIKEFSCKVCSFTYYHNVAVGVGALLELDDKILMIERGKDPGKGKLDLPGGFVDPKESAEEALSREIREEVGIEINAAMLKYLGSYPNVYEYEGVIYRVCDLFFYSRINVPPTDFDRREVQAVSLLSPAEIPTDKIAFPSVRACLTLFLETRKKQDAK